MAKKMVMKMVEVLACDKCGCEIEEEYFWEGTFECPEICKNCYNDLVCCDDCGNVFFDEDEEWVNEADLCYSCCKNKIFPILKTLYERGENLNTLCKEALKS